MSKQRERENNTVVEYFDRLPYGKIEKLREIIGVGELGWLGAFPKLSNETKLEVGRVVFGVEVETVEMRSVMYQAVSVFPDLSARKREMKRMRNKRFAGRLPLLLAVIYLGLMALSQAFEAQMQVQTQSNMTMQYITLEIEP